MKPFSPGDPVIAFDPLVERFVQATYVRKFDDNTHFVRKGDYIFKTDNEGIEHDYWQRLLNWIYRFFRKPPSNFAA